MNNNWLKLYPRSYPSVFDNFFSYEGMLDALNKISLDIEVLNEQIEGISDHLELIKKSSESPIFLKSTFDQFLSNYSFDLNELHDLKKKVYEYSSTYTTLFNIEDVALFLGDLLIQNRNIKWDIDKIDFVINSFNKSHSFGTYLTCNPSIKINEQFVKSHFNYIDFKFLPARTDVLFTNQFLELIEPFLTNNLSETNNKENNYVFWASYFRSERIDLKFNWLIFEICFKYHLNVILKTKSGNVFPWAEDEKNDVKDRQKAFISTVSVFAGYIATNSFEGPSSSAIANQSIVDFEELTVNFHKLNLDESFLWNTISKCNYKFDILFLDKHQNKINWDYLSFGPSIILDDFFCEKYKHNINWSNLSRNTTIEWKLDFIINYKDKFDCEALSNNNSIKWDIVTLLEVEELLNWKSLSQLSYIINNQSIRNEFYQKLGLSKDIRDSELNRYSYNQFGSSTIDILEKNKTVIKPNKELQLRQFKNFSIDFNTALCFFFEKKLLENMSDFESFFPQVLTSHDVPRIYLKSKEEDKTWNGHIYGWDKDEFSFGKYKGGSVDNIIYSDFGYVRWCILNLEHFALHPIKFINGVIAQYFSDHRSRLDWQNQICLLKTNNDLSKVFDFNWSKIYGSNMYERLNSRDEQIYDENSYSSFLNQMGSNYCGGCDSDPCMCSDPF
jgi:hypothetical protein